MKVKLEEIMKKYLRMVGNVLKYALIYLVFQMAAGIILGISISVKYDGMLTQVELQEKIMQNIYFATALAALVSFLIYVLLLRKKEENLWQRCRFKRISLKNTLLIILLSIGMSVFTNSIVNVTYQMFPSYEKVSSGIVSGMSSIFGILSIIIFLPAFEELLFRGLIFKELRKNINMTASIILQALVFAIFHGNLLQGIYTFILGIILALVYTWTKSIWSCIILHVIYNILGTMIMPYIVNQSGVTIYIYILIGIITSIASLVYIFREQGKTDELVDDFNAY